MPLPPPPHTHHHHEPPVGSEDRDSNSSSLQWPGKTCPPHQTLPLCQGYHGGSNHIQRCVLYHNTVIGASLSEPHISVLNASCACMFEHLLHAHTSLMHTPPSCTHLPHTHTSLMHTPLSCTHLSHAHTSLMHTPPSCTHLPHAHTSLMHTPPSCTHLPHAHTSLTHTHTSLMHTESGQELGMELEGVRNDPQDQCAVFIRSITPGSPAHLSGALQ